jgi:hypothetical protein
MSRFKVRLRIFRGAEAMPLYVRHVRVLAARALDAICRAEALLNVKLPDNEYAAGCAVWPVGRAAPVNELPMAA